jgi:hypothetical protein
MCRSRPPVARSGFQVRARYPASCIPAKLRRAQVPVPVSAARTCAPTWREVCCQNRNVVVTFTQRRQNKRHYIESEEQILTKASLCDFLFQISIGRCNQTDVDGECFSSADTFKFALLQNAQQFYLHCRAEITNLIEEECAACRRARNDLYAFASRK